MLPQIERETYWEKIQKLFWYVGQLLAFLYLCVFMIAVCSYLTGVTLNREPHNRFGETSEFDTRSLWPGSKSKHQTLLEKLDPKQKLSVMKGSLQIVATTEFCSKFDKTGTDASVCFFEHDLKFPKDCCGTYYVIDAKNSQQIFSCNGDKQAVISDDITTESMFFKKFQWNSGIPTTFADFDSKMSKRGSIIGLCNNVIKDGEDAEATEDSKEKKESRQTIKGQLKNAVEEFRKVLGKNKKIGSNSKWTDSLGNVWTDQPDFE